MKNSKRDVLSIRNIKNLFFTIDHFHSKYYSMTTQFYLSFYEKILTILMLLNLFQRNLY